MSVTLSSTEKKFWIAFNLVKGIGAVRVKNLIEYFGSLEIAWQAPAEGLQAARLPAKVLENLLVVRKSLELDVICENIDRQGIHVICWDDEEYPRRLKEIDQPPPVIYVRGSLQPEDDFAVAIVGTRKVTAYGRQIANEVAGFLAFSGVTVISGLARGVDAIAHDAAVKAGGRTLAVLGCGVDITYPPEHGILAQAIMAHGALISDYAPGTPPDAANFPPRNRIISGLARAVVVVEAGDKSGALITAAFAAGQGREVFAVPGQIYAPLSRGTNRLIQEGASPLLKPQDILDGLSLGNIQQHHTARILLPADSVEEAILHVLGSEPVYIDEIVSLSGLPISQVSATLTMMELKGMVHHAGGMNYHVVRESMANFWTENHD